MRSFKDSAGRNWDIEINPWFIKLVLSRTGFKLANLLDNNMALYGELTRDPLRFMDVLVALVSEQMETRKVTEEQFFKAIPGDPLEEAYEAFSLAFEDFCPSHLRKTLRAARAKTKLAMEKVTEKALKKIEAIDVEKELLVPPSTSSNSVIVPPALSASIPEG